MYMYSQFTPAAAKARQRGGVAGQASLDEPLPSLYLVFARQGEGGVNYLYVYIYIEKTHHR